MNIDEGLFCSSCPLGVWQGPRKFREPHTGLLCEWWSMYSAGDNWRYLCPFTHLGTSLKMSHILEAWYNAFKWQKSAHESSFTLLITINYSYIQNASARMLQWLGPYISSHCCCFHCRWVKSFLFTRNLQWYRLLSASQHFWRKPLWYRLISSKTSIAVLTTGSPVSSKKHMSS